MTKTIYLCSHKDHLGPRLGLQSPSKIPDFLASSHLICHLKLLPTTPPLPLLFLFSLCITCLANLPSDNLFMYPGRPKLIILESPKIVFISSYVLLVHWFSTFITSYILFSVLRFCISNIFSQFFLKVLVSKTFNWFYDFNSLCSIPESLFSFTRHAFISTSILD